MQLKNKNLFQTKAYINGEWAVQKSGKTFEVVNPSNLQTIATIPDLGKSETRQAIEAAAKAFSEWKEKTPAERSKVLRKWFELQMENADDLATILTTEQGKPHAEAKAEIGYGASFVEWFAEEAKRGYGDVVPTYEKGKRITVIKQPIGVVGAITPWNFPNAMITRKVAPALAAGCTVVIKPAQQTPLSALALAYLAEKAGFPKGVFNIVTTNDAKRVGEELTTNRLVRKFSFTGSTKVGKLLMQQCASTVKKVSLELGGNAPFIVFEDADLEAAVEGAIACKYRNAGQTCICANRFFVQESVYDEFCEKLARATEALKVGDGLAKGTDIGPLIDKSGFKKVKDLMKDAEQKGAKVLTGGAELKTEKGYFFQPTVLCDVTSKMDMSSTEIFGPVSAVQKFKTEADAIRMANDTPFGLAAYFYGKDYARLWRVAEALEYGMVGINTGKISTAVAPFGGVKESGIGREGSKYGMEEFMEVKYMCWDIGV